MAASIHYQNNPYYSSDPQAESCPMPLHLYLLLLLLLLPVGLAPYLNTEQLGLVVVVLPLLLAIHWQSDRNSNARQWWVPFLVPVPERESLHRAGRSPWGVGFLVALLLFLISNQSYFRENWLPIILFISFSFYSLLILIKTEVGARQVATYI